MNVTLQPEHALDEATCQSATGKSFAEWFAAIENFGPEKGRREVINWLYDQTGRGKDMWWATTLWVEFERAKGIVNKKDGLAEGYNICATKTIAASVDDVYRAFTDPAHGAWLGANAAAEGSPYKDGGGNSGTWLRLRLGKDVRIAWQTKGVDTPTQVDAMFAEKGGKTGITLNHQRIQTRAEADGLRAAWGAAFDRLKAQLEGSK